MLYNNERDDVESNCSLGLFAANRRLPGTLNWMKCDVKHSNV